MELKSSVFYCLLLKVNYDNLLLVSDNKIPPGLTHRKMGWIKTDTAGRQTGLIHRLSVGEAGKGRSPV